MYIAFNLTSQNIICTIRLNFGKKGLEEKAKKEK